LVLAHLAGWLCCVSRAQKGVKVIDEDGLFEILKTRKSQARHPTFRFAALPVLLLRLTIGAHVLAGAGEEDESAAQARGGQGQGAREAAE
jgi:hypothetical protein